jgi:DNA polymerase I-like protein with 3'-5' exonuclease and polymerase domains
MYSYLSRNYEIEMKVSKLVASMSARGVRLDMDKCHELKAYYEGEIVRCHAKLAEMGHGDLNPGSSVAKLDLFESLGMESEYRTRKKSDGTKTITKSADKKALGKWQDKSPVAYVLLEMSEAQHQLNSFILPFITGAVKHGNVYRLHPQFNSIGARTMRMSCSKPNLQNITSEASAGHLTGIEFRARECFVPDEGHYWLGLDYKQIEIWLTFFLAQDPVGMKNLLDGVDMHTFMAKATFGHYANYEEELTRYRKKAKIINFSMPYGTGADKLADSLNCTPEEARRAIKTYWDTYRGVKGLKDRLVAAIKANGYITDIFGYVYWQDPKFAYKGLNTYIQGPAAGIVKRAMLNCEDVFKGLGYGETLLQIHDELMFQIPLDKPDPTKYLEEAMQDNFHTLVGMPDPFGVDACHYSKSWGEKDEVR